MLNIPQNISDGPPRSENRFFDAEAITIISNPCRWRLISPFSVTANEDLSSNVLFHKWLKHHHHRHPFYEVLVAVKGTTLFGIENSVFRCKPGTLVLISPYQAHACKYLPSDNQLYHIWVSFISSMEAFAQFIYVQKGHVRRLHEERCVIPVDIMSRILGLLQTIEKSAAPTKTEQARLLLMAFFAELINRLIETGYQTADMIDHEIIQRKQISIICANIREGGKFNMTLASTASAVGYSYSHFARLFKRITGHTFHQHIEGCRIERAKKLLTKRTPYKTIADTLGFADESILCRWLNKYRKALKL